MKKKVIKLFKNLSILYTIAYFDRDSKLQLGTLNYIEALQKRYV